MFTRPTLAALRQMGRAAFAARLPGADLTLRRSNLGVSADVLAGMVNLEYGYMDWLAAALMPDQAVDDYLARWMTIYKVPVLGATPAAGNVTFTGNTGAPVPIATTLAGGAYATQAAGVLVAGTATIAVVALAGGTAGNAVAGTSLTLDTALPNVQGTAVVAAGGLTGGTDTDTSDQQRARLLLRIQQPPQGGDAEDYVEWARSVPGVTRAWCLPLNRGAGTVDVTFVMDGRTNIFPLTADVAAVQAAINANKPVTADSVVFAPAMGALNLTITGLVPNTAAVKAAIAAAFADLLTRVASPAGIIAFADIDAAISSAAGVVYHRLTSPANVDVTMSAGTLAVPGVITYA